MSASTDPQKVKDLIHKFGWDAMVRLSALGIKNLAEAQVFFVDSGAANALDADDGLHGLTIDAPLATIDYAVGLCTANDQSIIIVCPGHAETIATAAALVTADVAGIKIIGIGEGSKRPTITLTTSTSAIAFTISAVNVTVDNILTVCSIDAVAKVYNITGANCTLNDIEHKDNAATTEAAIGILATDVSDLKIVNYKHNGFVTGDACTDGISLDGCTRVEIINPWIRGKFSVGAINFASDTESVGVVIKNPVIENGTTALSLDIVDTIGGSNWSVIDGWDVVGNYHFSGGDNAALASDDVAGVSAAVAAISTTGVTSAPTANTLADILHKNGSFTYDNTTDSLEAIRDIIDTNNTADQVDLDAILLDTGTTIPGTITTVSNKITAGVKQIAIKNTGDMTGMDTGEVLFTVTGDVLARITAVVKTAVTSTSGTTTLETGITGNTALLTVQDAVDNTAFAINDCWTKTVAADDPGAELADEWVVISGGLDIILTISADDLTTGVIAFYCEWTPLSVDGNVVAA